MNKKGIFACLLTGMLMLSGAAEANDHHRDYDDHRHHHNYNHRDHNWHVGNHCYKKCIENRYGRCQQRCWGRW